MIKIIESHIWKLESICFWLNFEYGVKSNLFLNGFQYLIWILNNCFTASNILGEQGQHLDLVQAKLSTNTF